MDKRCLPTLSEVISWREGNPIKRAGSLAQRRLRAEQEWAGAIAAFNEMVREAGSLDSATSDLSGVVLSGPFPVLDQPELVQQLSTWIFTVDAPPSARSAQQLLPADRNHASFLPQRPSTLALLPYDPLAAEQFCVGLTAEFGVVLVLGETSAGEPAFQFSFDPTVVWQAWQVLRSRLVLTNASVLKTLDLLVEQFALVEPDYRLVARFTRLLLAHLPDSLEWEAERQTRLTERIHSTTIGLPLSDAASSAAVDALLPHKFLAGQPLPSPELKVSLQDHGVPQYEHPASDPFAQVKANADTELLQAIAHEVRTPLTTIRTLTRLVLKRKDLNPDVIKRLEIIDRECTEQIDRFNLIFRAVELETAQVKHPLSPPAAISLKQVFQQNVPRWQEQARERSLTLDVGLPQSLPRVLADPSMLDQVLTGLIDRITHSLPPGGHIKVQVQRAGHQLKLQFHSYPQLPDRGVTEAGGAAVVLPKLKSVGQMLMFQPETGNLSLNLAVTKNLFQALGGKLIVRQRPRQEEVLTVFLPLEPRATPDD